VDRALVALPDFKSGVGR